MIDVNKQHPRYSIKKEVLCLLPFEVAVPISSIAKDLGIAQQTVESNLAAIRADGVRILLKVGPSGRYVQVADEDSWWKVTAWANSYYDAVYTGEVLNDR